MRFVQFGIRSRLGFFPDCEPAFLEMAQFCVLVACGGVAAFWWPRRSSFSALCALDPLTLSIRPRP